MKIVVLDGYTLNPGDLSWDGIAALGGVAIMVLAIVAAVAAGVFRFVYFQMEIFTGSKSFFVAMLSGTI